MPDNSFVLKTDLSRFDNSWYTPGAGKLKKLLWYVTNLFIFNSGIFPFTGVKISLLRIFGAMVGKHVNIKPFVNIKYPWRLTIGDYSWIGENVWIDNLDNITIGAHCCISQGTMLLCGNHDYKKESFNLITKPIILEDGVWIGAKAIVCPGVICGSHSILTVGSVAIKNLEGYSIYQGNPAVFVRKREMMLE